MSIVALWWIPAGAIPTAPEAMERLTLLDRDGPTSAAFTFQHRFAPPGDTAKVEADERDVCRT